MANIEYKNSTNTDYVVYHEEGESYKDERVKMKG